MRILGIALLAAALVTALADLALFKLGHGASGLIFILMLSLGYTGNELLLRHGNMSLKILFLLNVIVLALYTVIGLSILSRSQG